MPDPNECNHCAVDATDGTCVLCGLRPDGTIESPIRGAVSERALQVLDAFFNRFPKADEDSRHVEIYGRENAVLRRRAAEADRLRAERDAIRDTLSAFEDNQDTVSESFRKRAESAESERDAARELLKEVISATAVPLEVLHSQCLDLPQLSEELKQAIRDAVTTLRKAAVEFTAGKGDV